MRPLAALALCACGEPTWPVHEWFAPDETGEASPACGVLLLAAAPPPHNAAQFNCLQGDSLGEGQLVGAETVDYTIEGDRITLIDPEPDDFEGSFPDVVTYTIRDDGLVGWRSIRREEPE